MQVHEERSLLKKNNDFQFKFSDLYCIPNVLCYIRIALVPLFLAVYLNAQKQADYYWAVGIILIASATDVLDGFIARRFNMVTDLGKLIDPIADKLMQFSMLCVLIYKNKLVIIPVAVMVVKELTSLILGLFVYNKCVKRLSGAKWYGKICTVIVDCAVLVLLAFPQIPDVTQIIIIAVVTFALVMAWLLYTRQYCIMYRDSKNGEVGYKVY